MATKTEKSAAAKPSADKQAKKLTCCLCGNPITKDAFGWPLGNNPWPLAAKDTDRCCSDCDYFVLLARVQPKIIPFLNFALRFRKDMKQRDELARVEYEKQAAASSATK